MLKDRISYMRVITYTLHKCVKCMRCLKTCPFEAITIKDERVLISADKCINCGACISACKHSGLSAKGSTLVDLQNYKIKIGLVPSSIYCDCSNETDARRLNAALLKLGFDELVSLSPYEGAVYEKVNDLLKEKKGLYISSFCPVVNELIEKQYPMLLDNQINFEYPSVFIFAILFDTTFIAAWFTFNAPNPIFILADNDIFYFLLLCIPPLQALKSNHPFSFFYAFPPL